MSREWKGLGPPLFCTCLFALTAAWAPIFGVAWLLVWTMSGSRDAYRFYLRRWRWLPDQQHYEWRAIEDRVEARFGRQS